MNRRKPDLNVQTPPPGWWRLEEHASEEDEAKGGRADSADSDTKLRHSVEKLLKVQESGDEDGENDKGEEEEVEVEEGEEEEEAVSAPKKIKKVELNIGNKVGFVLYNVLTPAECQHLIDQTEALGYKPMPEYPTSYRSNTRVIVDDDELAQEVWKRVVPFIPGTFDDRRGKWEAYGLNARWRFCRYTPGQHFSAHHDGCFEVSPTDRSQYTWMFYLNDVSRGGATVFLEGGRKVVRPKAGMVLVFQHNILHEGERLKAGKKYLMRSDVMFHRVDPPRNRNYDEFAL